MAFKFVETMALTALRKKFPQFFWQYMIKPMDNSIAYCTKPDSRVAGPWKIFDNQHSDYLPTPSVNAVSPSQVFAPTFPQPPPTNSDGSLPKSRLRELANLLLNTNASIRDLSIEFPVEFIRNANGIDRLMNIHAKNRDLKPFVTVLYGMTGSGKSTYAMNYAHKTYGPDEIFTYDSLSSSGQEWWEGLTDQKFCLIEEMGPGKFNLQRLLRILDRFPVTVPVKGGSRKLKPVEIMITSNFPPSDWFPDVAKDKVAALLRRIDLCFKIIIKQDLDGRIIRNEIGGIDYQWLQDVDNMCPPCGDTTYDDWLIQLHKDNGYCVTLPEPTSSSLDSIIAPEVSNSALLENLANLDLVEHELDRSNEMEYHLPYFDEF